MLNRLKKFYDDVDLRMIVAYIISIGSIILGTFMKDYVIMQYQYDRITTSTGWYMGFSGIKPIYPLQEIGIVLIDIGAIVLVLTLIWTVLKYTHIYTYIHRYKIRVNFSRGKKNEHRDR